MNPEIIVALIGLAGMIITTVLTARATQNKLMQEIHTSNEVQNVKIQHLTDEVHRHNNFAEAIPHLDEKINVLNREMKEVKNDIKELQMNRRSA